MRQQKMNPLKRLVWLLTLVICLMILPAHAVAHDHGKSADDTVAQPDICLLCQVAGQSGLPPVGKGCLGPALTRILLEILPAGEQRLQVMTWDRSVSVRGPPGSV